MKRHSNESEPSDVLNEMDVLNILSERRVLLDPFAIEHVDSINVHSDGAYIQARWHGLRVTFLAHFTARGSPRVVRDTIDLSRGRVSFTPTLPLIVAPYLGEAALDLLETEGVSGVDLCGNGVIVEHERFLVRRGGAPNKYPLNTPLRDPYRGQAGVVVRALISRRTWPSLSELHAHLAAGGTPVSLSLCSKAIAALHDDDLIIKDRGILRATGIERILGQLEHAWDRVRMPPPVSFSLPGDPLTMLARHLQGRPRWVVSGASSVGRYANLAQGGPLQVLVDDVHLVAAMLGARHEDIPAFAAVHLQQCDEPGAYCGAVEHEGVRWASPLQTWLELRCGDARQVQAAQDVHRWIRNPHG